MSCMIGVRVRMGMTVGIVKLRIVEVKIVEVKIVEVVVRIDCYCYCSC